MPADRSDALVVRIVPLDDRPRRLVVEPRSDDQLVGVVHEERRDGAWRETGREVAVQVEVDERDGGGM